MDEYCGNCKWHKYDESYEDWRCEHEDSDYYGDFTFFKSSCDCWEEK